MTLSRRAFLGRGAALAGAPALAIHGPAPARQDPKFASTTGRGFASDAIHAGEEDGMSVTSIHMAKNYKGSYQRPPSNPTVGAFEAKIRSLEGGEAAVSAPCGMSIITQALLTLLSPGDHLVAHRCLYDNIMGFLQGFLRRWGVEVAFVDMNDLDALRAALAAKNTKLVLFEPYVNPTMEVLDAPKIIALAREAEALTLVDNTWLTPWLFQPLRHGADLVMHSATKYIGGHGSAMGGVVAGKKDLIQKIKGTVGVMGGILRPMDAFLLTQGLKTLPLRMQRHGESALKVAKFLETHPKVERVRYGGLPGDPGHKVGSTYLSACGGMLGVEWKEAATHSRFPGRLKMCKPWVSLGDVVTLVSTRAEEPNRAIPARFTRVSIGLEDAGDIIADFRQALE